MSSIKGYKRVTEGDVYVYVRPDATPEDQARLLAAARARKARRASKGTFGHVKTSKSVHGSVEDQVPTDSASV